MAERVTIKDIAARLGISHATVSRALSGHPHVNAETRARIQAAVAELGYIPNSGARLLRGQSSTLLGLVVPDIENEFYATVARTLAESANAAHHQLVLAISGDDADVELRLVRELTESRVAGVVVVPSGAQRRETVALLNAVPTVQLIRRTPLLHGDWVGIDDVAGLAEAARHVVTQGHRRIAYVGGDEGLSSGHARREGFLRGLRESGADPDAVRIVLGPPRAAFAREAMRRLWSGNPRPTAVVLGGARVTFGALQAVHDLGIVMPDDLSLVGFGDPAWCAWFGPGLTTLSLPVRDLAFAAASMLLRRVRAGASAEGETESPAEAVFSARLVARGSVAPPSA